MKRLEPFLPFLVLLMASIFLVLDLFLHPGRNITFDGHIHMTTIAQFVTALKDGEFPVTWSDGFSVYGAPIPLVAHQTTAYLGGVLALLTNNVVLAYNLLYFLGAVLSSWLFYLFLRKHVSRRPALVATLLFTVAPYRILNIYIRGALPEFLSTVFMVLALLGLHEFLVESKKRGALFFLAGLSLLGLTHPMMLVIAAFLLVPYWLYFGRPLQKRWRTALWLGAVSVLSLGVAGYYILPLLLEMKYFYIGSLPPEFLGDMYLSWKNFFDPQWYYFFTSHPGPRGHFIQVGLLETLLMILGAVLFALGWRRKKDTPRSLLGYALLTAIPLLFFLLPIAHWFYTHFFFLRSLQFPWRMLSAFLFLPPLVLAGILEKYQRTWLLLITIVLIFVLRFPQLYGKNFVTYPQQHYFQTIVNLHGQNLAPIWSGKAEDYPRPREQMAIISGEGTISHQRVKNASRRFTLNAATPVRIVDYTFYFPGWQVLVDGAPTTIEFQDMNYRGVITYTVPAGEHQVRVEFQPTKVRLVGYLITLGAAVGSIVFWVLLRNMPAKNL